MNCYRIKYKINWISCGSPKLRTARFLPIWSELNFTQSPSFKINKEKNHSPLLRMRVIYISNYNIITATNPNINNGIL